MVVKEGIRMFGIPISKTRKGQAIVSETSDLIQVKLGPFFGVLELNANGLQLVSNLVG